jgi:hypothetical protein
MPFGQVMIRVSSPERFVVGRAENGRNFGLLMSVGKSMATCSGAEPSSRITTVTRRLGALPCLLGSLYNIMQRIVSEVLRRDRAARISGVRQLGPGLSISDTIR